jgi:hypothetical protein
MSNDELPFQWASTHKKAEAVIQIKKRLCNGKGQNDTKNNIKQMRINKA